jgi:hypothetical protein
MQTICRFLFSVLTVVILFSSCKKEDDKKNDNNNTTGITNNPVAVSENDNNAGGVYKAIVTGSSGYALIYFKNGNGLVYALLNFDGNHDSLICPALNGYTLPGADITNAIFTSALGTQDSIIFSVKGNGTNPSISIRIPGHTTSSSILKETSKQEVKIYSGNGYDTLVKGYYDCGSSKVTTIGSVRMFNITILVQGSTAVILPGNHLAPCPGNSIPNSAVATIDQNNEVDFSENGPPVKSGKIKITDADVTGSIICPPPIDLGGEIDAYNTYIKATRVK